MTERHVSTEAYDPQQDKDKNQLEKSNSTENPAIFSTLTPDIIFKIPANPHHPNNKPNQSMNLTFLGPNKPTPLPKFPFSKNIIRSQYTNEEIIQTADKVAAGKPVSICDPIFLSEVIEELISRRLELLSSGSYLAAKQLTDRTDALRAQFRSSQASSGSTRTITLLEDKKKLFESQLSEFKAESKQKTKELMESHKNQLTDLHIRHDEKRSILEDEWQRPSKQRFYTKQSPELLENRLLQVKSVLVGDLVNADRLKRENSKSEKIETAQKYAELMEAFEAARGRQEIEFNEQIKILKENQQIELEAFKNQKIDMIVALTNKIQFIDSMISEEKDLVKKGKGASMRKSFNLNLPMIEKTSQNIQQKNAFRHRALEIEPQPLHLPPLTIHMRKKRSKSQAK